MRGESTAYGNTQECAEVRHLKAKTGDFLLFLGGPANKIKGY